MTMQPTIRLRLFAILLYSTSLAGTALIAPTDATARTSCPGDCNGDREVTVDELVRGVNIALITQPVDACPAFDRDGNSEVTVDELVLAVNRALDGCPGCASYNRLRNLYFGDLHVHTTYSFDVNAFGVDTTPEQAYRFARGEEILLPPLDANGRGTQPLRIDRPLDFVAVTDHSEYLGEIEACTTPGEQGYDSAACENYRRGGNAAIVPFGLMLTSPQPRKPEICGVDGQNCAMLSSRVWERVKEAAEQANDGPPLCGFTAFVAYEYSSNPEISTLHRNVIFRNASVPLPASYFERRTPQDLWAYLKTSCLDAGNGCDVLAIPHNSNESNGKMFFVEYPGAVSIEEQRAQAAFRLAMEPVVEVFQHKGDSECMNGFAGLLGAPDELCDFEKRRRPPFEDCGDGVGRGGIINAGCISRNDFARGALLAGLEEAERIGTNPYEFGMIGATDTHNGAPGAVSESAFIGHRGIEDDTPEKRLGPGMLQPGGIIFNPGGLAAVWAEENSRDAIFDALRRREVFATSGPRMAVRFFGGWELNQPLCGDPQMLEKGYALGVPMGGVLPPKPAPVEAPSFVISAQRDPGTEMRPGVALQRIQVIKGWIEEGKPHYQVHDVAGDPNNGAGVDLNTCRPTGIGFDSLCRVWTDPDFDPAQPAYYYVRVIENPSCRWSTYECNRLPAEQRPAACGDPTVPKTIQERAWTSPIWYRPG